MNLKQIKTESNMAKILVKGTSKEFMNAIRRIVMGSVPTIAVDEVMLYDNTSNLFDEFLCHRLGLVPLTTDLKYNIGETVKLSLEKEGPGMVYSGDIKSTDPKVKVADKRIPLVELKKDQRVKLELVAEMNKGKKHVKHSPAIIAFYEVPVIKSKENCTGCEKCVKACPVNVLALKRKTVELVDPYNCTLCGYCRDACKEEALDLSYKEDEFILRIEPIGQLDSRDVLVKACELLKERAEEFDKEFKKI
jgi:DNA-directed RNA polymerase subunit D